MTQKSGSISKKRGTGNKSSDREFQYRQAHSVQESKPDHSQRGYQVEAQSKTEISCPEIDEDVFSGPEINQYQCQRGLRESNSDQGQSSN